MYHSITVLYEIILAHICAIRLIAVNRRTWVQSPHIRRQRALVSLRLDIRYNEARLNLSWRVLEVTPTRDQRETELNRQKSWGKSHEGGSLQQKCCNKGVAAISYEGQYNASKRFCQQIYCFANLSAWNSYSVIYSVGSSCGLFTHLFPDRLSMIRCHSNLGHESCLETLRKTKFLASS